MRPTDERLAEIAKDPLYQAVRPLMAYTVDKWLEIKNSSRDVLVGVLRDMGESDPERLCDEFFYAYRE